MNFDYKRLVKYEINVGEKEKKIRLWAGAAAVFISIFTAKILLLLVGIILIATGYSRFCPVYSAMEKNTCEDAAASPDNNEADPS